MSQTTSEKSLSETVAAYFERRALLLEFAQSELLNISQIARQIQSEILTEVRKKVPVATIGMAIRRYLKNTSQYSSIQDFPSHIEISTRTGVYELGLVRSERNRELVNQLLREIQEESTESISVLEGAYEIVIYAQQRSITRVKKCFKRAKKKSEMENLACVTVDWPPSTKDIPGIYYRVTRALMMANVSIQAFHTIGSEMTVFVREEVLGLAHEEIRNLLNG